MERTSLRRPLTQGEEVMNIVAMIIGYALMAIGGACFVASLAWVAANEIARRWSTAMQARGVIKDFKKWRDQQ